MKRTDFDRQRYQIWALPHPLILHWVLNPGVAFNEVVLGQRIPKISLIDRDSEKPFMERTMVPCPHCKTLNDGRLWGKGNAFGHWFGYLCPVCEGTIPCQWNVFSLIILLVTFPVWSIPIHFLKPRWVEYEKQRLKRTMDQPLVEARSINWPIRGTFFFGGFMWIFMSLVPYLLGIWSRLGVLMGVPLWLLAGLLWGLSMQRWMNKKGNVGQKDVTAEESDKQKPLVPGTED